MNKVNVKALGLACGIWWGIVMLVMGFLSMWIDYSTAMFDIMESIYPGVQATNGGAILGGIFGFLDGFVFGAVIGWLYNKFSG